MKVVLFNLLVLVAVCEGMKLETRSAQLPAPTCIKVTVLEGPAFEVSWDKVEAVDKKDPLVGYKVKVWDVKGLKTTKYIIMNGEVKQTEEDEPMELMAQPTSKPEEILVKADETKATFKKVQVDVTYEIRVAAYTKKQESPPSSPVRIKICKKKS